jgi:hypothetical protein
MRPAVCERQKAIHVSQALLCKRFVSLAGLWKAVAFLALAVSLGETSRFTKASEKRTALLPFAKAGLSFASAGC